MLINAELLTEQERKAFKSAKAEMELAGERLKDVVKYIGGLHGMSTESYMEWRSWAKVDGKYILHYRE